MKQSRWLTWGMIGLMGAGGTWVLLHSLLHLPAGMGSTQWLVLLAAAALHLLRVDLFRYHDPRTRESASITVGMAGIFLVLGLYGWQVAVLTAALQALASACVHQMAWFRAVFNVGLLAISTFVAGWAYQWLGGLSVLWETPVVLASMAAISLYFLVQRTCTSLVICFSTGRSFRSVWAHHLGWMLVQQGGLAAIGLLLGRFVGMGMTFSGLVLLGSPMVLLHHSYKIFADRTKEYVDEINHANNELAALNDELKSTNDELIQTLGSVLDARDRYTFGHSAQVATYSVALGEKLGVPPQELERLRQAAFLHDIGKVGIPESILFKPGKLEPEERRIMQAHAELGYRITRQIHSLAPVAEIIRQHHEWYGGGGYPRNLKGEQILLAARIIGVADALDTLISDRPYRKGKPVEVAFQEIRRCTGTQFDPEVVAALEQLLRERGGLWFENSASRVGESPLAFEVAASLEFDLD